MARRTRRTRRRRYSLRGVSNVIKSRCNRKCSSKPKRRRGGCVSACMRTAKFGPGAYRIRKR